MLPFNVSMKKAVVAREVKMMRRLYENSPAETLTIGLLGEHAVMAMFEAGGWLASHQSFIETQRQYFGDTDSASSIDIMARPSPGRPWLYYQVKSSLYRACWIKTACLEKCQDQGVTSVFFVDVKIDGSMAHCEVHHQVSPDEIKRSWVRRPSGLWVHPQQANAEIQTGVGLC